MGFGPPLYLQLSILGPHSCYPGGLGIAAIWIPQGCSHRSRAGTAAQEQGTPELAGRWGVKGSTPGRRR